MKPTTSTVLLLLFVLFTCVSSTGGSGGGSGDSSQFYPTGDAPSPCLQRIEAEKAVADRRGEYSYYFDQFIISGGATSALSKVMDFICPCLNEFRVLTPRPELDQYFTTKDQVQAYFMNIATNVYAGFKHQIVSNLATHGLVPWCRSPSAVKVSNFATSSLRLWVAPGVALDCGEISYETSTWVNWNGEWKIKSFIVNSTSIFPWASGPSTNLYLQG